MTRKRTKPIAESVEAHSHQETGEHHTLGPVAEPSDSADVFDEVIAAAKHNAQHSDCPPAPEPAPPPPPLAPEHQPEEPARAPEHHSHGHARHEDAPRRHGEHDQPEHGQHAERHARKPVSGLYRDSEHGIRLDREHERRPGRHAPEILLSFAEKPPEHERAKLKDEGFRFAGDTGAWTLAYSAANLVLAKRVLNELLKGRGGQNAPQAYV